jgi:AmmeMemoRadiSam system protein B
MGACPVVPVLFGNVAGEEHVEFGKALANLMEPGDLLIASTDLSHFLTEEMANKIDHKSIQAILSKNPRNLIGGLADDTCSMCGGPAVVAAMACATACGADDWKLLDYSTSAKASGDTSRVVGYAAVSMEYGDREKNT